MKINFLCLSVLVIGETVVGARTEALRTDINPALQYYQAFLLTPDLPRADSDYLLTNNWLGQQLPERVGKLIEGYDNQFKLVRQAARSTVPCDWGIDLSAGPATMMPHLARGKAVAVMTRLRVTWHLQNGRQDEAREDWLAALALARNISRDKTLISMLVQIAGESIDCSTIAASFGGFSPETLKQLEDGLESAPARLTLAECLGTEKSLSLDWTRRKILELQQQNPGNDAKVMEGIHQFLGFPPEGETDLWQALTEAAGGKSEGVLRLLSERDEVYEKIAGFVARPYAEFESQEKAFCDELERSRNPFVRETMPKYVQARQREFRILAYLAMVRAAIEYKLHGEAGFNSVSDPCGNGPLGLRRFVFQGVDRGFEVRSAFNLGRNLAVLIFVEKEGPAFKVDGNYPGQPLGGR
jgi:hypothetical protein